jgi:hypothetical protein
MINREYAEIRFVDMKGVQIFSTNSIMIDAVLNDLKALFPNFKVDREEKFFPLQERYWVSLKSLGDKDQDIGIWIIKKYLAEGWHLMDFNLDINNDKTLRHAAFSGTAKLVFDEN